MRIFVKNEERFVEIDGEYCCMAVMLTEEEKLSIDQNTDLEAFMFSTPKKEENKEKHWFVSNVLKLCGYGETNENMWIRRNK